MTELPALSLLSELGFKPTELLILALLWQNVKNTRVLLDKLVEKVGQLEAKVNQQQRKVG
jgi:DNA-binding MarR family transcriptional regulator